MKEQSRKLLSALLKLLLCALTGGATAYGVSSCTVNSGNRENSAPVGYPERMYFPRSSLCDVPRRSDTIKVIKESNTIYTND